MQIVGWERVKRDSSEYKACLAASTGTGAMIGGAVGPGAAFVPVFGTLAGYASGAFWGFVAGYLGCPYLLPAVKKKLEIGIVLSDSELRSAVNAMGLYANLRSADEAIKLVALVKAAKRARSKAGVCTNSTLVARQLLSSV